MLQNYYDNGMPAAKLQGARWLKSRRSNSQGNCVEIAELPGGRVAMRNSRHPDGPARLAEEAWAGAVIGMLVSVLLTRILTFTNRLWQVSPNDPITLAVVFAVVTAAGFFACYIPARRATRVDPMVALRHE